ncbi:MAG TPA: PAAR domain-containing protein [Kofleriaceae bacterium]|nr:PAAR domain-containing protein [Kofleriaceae bacterium]
MPPQGRVGDKAQVPADSHGCPGCAHPCIGPGTAGSPDVLTNGRPSLRLQDPGVHSSCCGPNTWIATKGSSTVFINNKPAHRKTDQTTHCGGVGMLVEGSDNVMVGG